MPLFMLISGYLFAFSVGRRKCREVFFGKLRSLVLPLFSWAVVVTGIFVVSGVLNGSGIAAPVEIISQLIYYFFHNFWFLWAVFWSSCIVLIGRSFFNDSLLFYTFVLVLTVFLPDEHCISLYKFMYPYFVIGYLFNTSDSNNKVLFRTIVRSPAVLIVTWILFVALIFFYNTDSYVYTSGYTILREGAVNLRQLGIDLYRFLIGLVGSSAFILILKLVYPYVNRNVQKGIGYIGMNSIGIYILSFVIFNDHLLRTFSVRLHGVNYVIVLVESIVVIAVTLLLSFLIKQFRFANTIFLGGRK